MVIFYDTTYKRYLPVLQDDSMMIYYLNRDVEVSERFFIYVFVSDRLKNWIFKLICE